MRRLWSSVDLRGLCIGAAYGQPLRQAGVVLACGSDMRGGSGRLPGAVGNGRVYSASGPGHYWARQMQHNGIRYE